MQWVYTAEVNNAAQRSLKRRKFTDLPSALKWSRKRSKRKDDIAAVTRRLEERREQEPAAVYEARVEHVFYGSAEQKAFDDLSLAKQWISAHARTDGDMPSITRRPKAQ